MKRLLLIALLVALAAVLAWLLVRCGPEKSSPPVAGGDCYERAEEKVATWKKEGRDAETIQKLFQAELARCSGMEGACAAFFGAGNADLAFLGRAVLTGSLSPAEYLARVKDRTGKMREARKTPALCDAYAQGDSDGDLVPDDRDKCPVRRAWNGQARTDAPMHRLCRPRRPTRRSTKPPRSWRSR